jgi:hypothetical protein
VSSSSFTSFSSKDNLSQQLQFILPHFSHTHSHGSLSQFEQGQTHGSLWQYVHVQTHSFFRQCLHLQTQLTVLQSGHLLMFSLLCLSVVWSERLHLHLRGSSWQ